MGWGFLRFFAKSLNLFLWGFELDLRIWILSLQGCNDLITGDD